MSVTQRLFGPSRKEVWRKLAAEVGGRYVEGGFWKGDKVEVSHDEWTLTLDTHTVSTGKVTVVYTRMRAPFKNPGGFRFVVYRKSVFSGLGKMLGMQDIEVGDPFFDDAFIIKGEHEGRVRTLLSSDAIRDLIARQKDIHFSVVDDDGWFGTRYPEGVDELRFQVVGVIKDIDRLKLLYDLFAETLDRLCEMGSAHPGDPGVELR